MTRPDTSGGGRRVYMGNEHGRQTTGSLEDSDDVSLGCSRVSCVYVHVGSPTHVTTLTYEYLDGTWRPLSSLRKDKV